MERHSVKSKRTTAVDQEVLQVAEIVGVTRRLHSQPPDVPRQTPSQEPPFSVNGLQEPQGESTLPRSRFLANVVVLSHQFTIIGRLSRDLLFLFTLCLVLAN